MDTATYAHYQLRNGLSVVVASDLKLQREAACMAVAVGQMSDPPGWEGLAHFTEHMLFMGTERFPDENGWGAYLSARGGSDNGEANPNPNPNPNPSPNPSPNPILTLTPTRRDRCRAHRLLL